MKEPLPPPASTMNQDGAALHWRPPISVITSLEETPSISSFPLPSSSSSTSNPYVSPDDLIHPDEFTTTEVSLTMVPYWNTFRSSKRERIYQWFRFTQNIQKNTLYIFTIFLLFGCLLTLTLEYEYTVYQNNSSYIIIPLLGRLLPILIILYITKYSSLWIKSPYRNQLLSTNSSFSSSLSRQSSKWLSSLSFSQSVSAFFSNSARKSITSSSSSSSHNIINNTIPHPPPNQTTMTSSPVFIYTQPKHSLVSTIVWYFHFHSWHYFYLTFAICILLISISVQLISYIQFQNIWNTSTDYKTLAQQYTLPWSPLVYTFILSCCFTYITNFNWWWCSIVTFINFSFCIGLVILPSYFLFQQHNVLSLVVLPSLGSILILFIMVWLSLSFINYNYDKFLRILYRYHILAKRKLFTLTDQVMMKKINYSNSKFNTEKSLLHMMDIILLEIQPKQNNNIIYASPAAKTICLPIIQDNTSVSPLLSSSILKYEGQLSDILFTSHDNYIHPDDLSFITSLHDQLYTYSEQYRKTLPVLKYNEIDNQCSIRIKLRYRYQRKFTTTSTVNTNSSSLSATNNNAGFGNNLSYVYVEGEIHVIIPHKNIPRGTKRIVTTDDISFIYMLHRIDESKYNSWESGILEAYPSNCIGNLPLLEPNKANIATGKNFSRNTEDPHSSSPSSLDHKDNISLLYDAHYMRSLYTALVSISTQFTSMYAISKAAATIWTNVLTIVHNNHFINNHTVPTIFHAQVHRLPLYPG